METHRYLPSRSPAAGAPPPRLSSDFDKRLAKRLRPRRLSSTGRLVVAVYALLALIVSVWVMRSQSIDWIFIAVAILAALMPIPVVQRRQRGFNA